MEAAASYLSLFYSCVQIYNNMFYNIVHKQVYLFIQIHQGNSDMVYLCSVHYQKKRSWLLR